MPADISVPGGRCAVPSGAAETVTGKRTAVRGLYLDIHQEHLAAAGVGGGGDRADVKSLERSKVALLDCAFTNDSGDARKTLVGLFNEMAIAAGADM